MLPKWQLQTQLEWRSRQECGRLRFLYVVLVQEENLQLERLTQGALRCLK